jgi:hypothetical protein
VVGHRILDPGAEVRLLPPQIMEQETGHREEKARHGEKEMRRSGEHKINNSWGNPCLPQVESVGICALPYGKKEVG